MKKTLLAAALLAGFAGVAHAETQVTLYGIIDTGIQYSQFTGHNAAGASVKTSSFGETWGAQSGSRWGMKGTEELGNGLKAIFQLESGFDSTNGYSGQGGRLFGRQAWVGLANAAWGQVEFGRIYSVPTALLAGLDPFAQGWGLANIGTTFTALNTNRLDNGVQYQSPVFAGFQFGANYSFNADDSTAAATLPAGGAKNEGGLMPGNASNSSRQFDLALNYTNGPLFVGASYSQMNVAHSTTTGLGATIREEIIGATYDFGVAKLFGAYSHGTNGFFVGSAAGLGSDGSSLTNLSAGGLGYNGTKSNSYMLGVSAPIGGATNLFASWQHSTLGGTSNLAVTSPTSDYVKYGAQASNIFSAGATYSLSKRTNLYAVASYDKGYANVNGQKAVDGIVGIRHQF